ncbi:NAD(P)/FAD-dependent oxidoreductase [Gilvimarinus sp. F26214L]|uniref:NAD(P)/FAD-dependent oxidoreductase n=1 Tax=Gilvimarinus sp. DZF01 TaxID=3461371 RepID=UPI00404571EF
MAHIVILGAGLGGLSTAFELRHKLDRGHRITVVSTDGRFQFTPSNTWVAVGWREPGETTLGVEPVLSKHHIDFVPSAAMTINAAARLVTLANGQRLDYDFLVIATGPRLAFDEVPGAGPEAHTLSLSTVDHAARAFAAYRKFLDEPGPVVIGALLGAGCFGPAYEYAFLLDRDLRKRKMRSRVPLTFVTCEPFLGHLGLGGVGDSRELLEAQFRDRDIRWMTNTRVRRADHQMLHCEEMNRKGGVEHAQDLPFKLAMMMPPLRGIDPVARVEGLCDADGFVLVDDHQRSPAHPAIFAAGACVAVPTVEQTPVPTGAPKTGYMIEAMASAVADNISLVIKGDSPSTQPDLNALCFIDSDDAGIAVVAIPQIPPRTNSWVYRGKSVHQAKIAAERYFLSRIRHGSATPVYERHVLKTLERH